MIKLNKSVQPKKLSDNASNWLKDLKDALEHGDKKLIRSRKARYNHPEIKDALLLETNGKCAYCESKIEHISHGDIEHIAPKSIKVEKTFQWDNLTLACTICNQNKGTNYSEADHERIIDPYEDEPSEHLSFHREVVAPRPDSYKGIQTEEILKLMRAPLFERRRNHIKGIDDLVLAIKNSPNDVQPMLKRTLYNNFLSPEKEFLAISRSYIKWLEDEGIL